MKKITLLLFLVLGSFAFSQYMIVGKDSVSLQDFKKDNLYGLQNTGIEKTLTNTQNFMLLQQLAAEKKADTLTYFKQRMSQKLAELAEEHFYPKPLVQSLLTDFVKNNQQERSIFFFAKQKTADDKTDYQKIYNDVVAGRVKMEDAIKTHLGNEVEPVYVKPGIMDEAIYSELLRLQPGSYTKLNNNPGFVSFAKLVNVRPSLGYLVFGTVSYTNDAEANTKKTQILNALKSGKKFSEVAKEFGSTDHEKNNGGVVTGSPTLPDAVYNALRGKKIGEYTDPILVGDKYFIFNIYDLVPYQLNEKSEPLFKREMMNSNYADKLQNQHVKNLKSTSAYKEFKDYETVKKSYAAFQAFKNDNALLYQFNKHQMKFGDLKKQVSEQFKELDGITPAEWSSLMDFVNNQFVMMYYSRDFEYLPQVKKEIDEYRRNIYSEYIFTDYLRNEIQKHPEWLTEHFNKNKSKYVWETRAQGRVAIIADDKLVDGVKKDIKDIKKWDALKKKYDGQLNDKNQILVHFEEGKMAKDADVFAKHNVPFKTGVYTTKIGERSLALAIDEILPPTAMTFEEAKELVQDAVTDETLQKTISAQRAKTKIVVEPAFMKDLEANFKK